MYIYLQATHVKNFSCFDDIVGDMKCACISMCIFVFFQLQHHSRNDLACGFIHITWTFSLKF